MYLHLGGDFSVPLPEVLCIIDLRNLSELPVNREFLEGARARRQIRRVCGEEEAKSMVLTGQTVYLSPISSTTLNRRIDAAGHLE